MHPPTGYTHVVEVTCGSAGLTSPGRSPSTRRECWSGRATSRPGPAGVRHPSGLPCEAVGANFDQVVKLTYYLVDATQLPVVREVRDQYINTQQPPPASTAVEVRRLVRDDLLIEIEAVAAIASFQPMTATA